MALLERFTPDSAETVIKFYEQELETIAFKGRAERIFDHKTGSIINGIGENVLYFTLKTSTFGVESLGPKQLIVFGQAVKWTTDVLMTHDMRSGPLPSRTLHLPGFSLQRGELPTDSAVTPWVIIDVNGVTEQSYGAVAVLGDSERLNSTLAHEWVQQTWLHAPVTAA